MPSSLLICTVWTHLHTLQLSLTIKYYHAEKALATVAPPRPGSPGPGKYCTGVQWRYLSTSVQYCLRASQPSADQQTNEWPTISVESQGYYGSHKVMLKPARLAAHPVVLAPVQRYILDVPAHLRCCTHIRTLGTSLRRYPHHH
jgi:hypothetical protein